MPVKRRLAKRRADLTDGQICWLRDIEPETPDECDGWAFHYFETDEDLEKLWAANRDWVIAQHVAEQPGTRPRLWWTYDAPEPGNRDETEAEYLDRLNLWLPGERRRVKRSLPPST
jgi:hypothetical protein